MNRWLALLLFVGGAVLGFLWLYVYGDDPWPEWNDYVVGGLLLVAGLAAWALCSWALWQQLRRRR